MAESIVGAVVNFVGEKLLECVAEPIKRWYDYLFRFYSNVEKLSEAKRKLKDARDGLQMLVDRAKNNAEEILPQVKTWLEETDEVLAIMVEIESEITDIQSVWLTKKFYCFSLSKKVKKTTETMEQLLGDCNFDVISQHVAPASMVPFPIGPTHEFESRKNIEKDVMSTLSDEKVSIMGICGMGGVGKTTMAKRVMNRMKGERMFDETVMVVVSQQVDMLKIQNELAEQLGLKLEVKSLPARAHELRTRLVGGKRILMVIDDVWKNLKLEDLGIPCESDFKECTILLTSRDRGVLNEMGAQKVCEIQTLSESEAWSLFQEKVGRCIDDQNLLAIAQKVVKECKGLPIGIVSVATALKDVKYKFQWDDALEQLKSSDPIDMPKVLEDVYKPLKLSYDFLGNQHAKSIFLLCCLFPEDSTIPLEELTAYALGLCIFERIRNLKQVRNRIYSLVEMLKNRFLLLEGWDQYHVRMYDVVRDVAIFIASEENNIKCGDCTWISPYLREGIKLPLGSVFPNLRLLWITNESADEELQISDNFFEGTTKLNVLSMTGYSLRSLPRSTKLLKNLRMLILYSCESLETISIVGLLVNLEILICCHCDSIKELPIEIGRLYRMRLLNLSYCEKLKTIAPRVISSLVELEELKMVKSFNKWEAKDNERKERKNARLEELEYLSNLTCLDIEVEDFALAAEEICLSQKIVKFNITIGDYSHWRFMSDMGLEKRMNLNLPKEITLGNWIFKFLNSAEHMRLVGEGSTKLELERQALQNLRSLTLEKCSTVKKLGNTVFPLLKCLELHRLPNLEVICDIDSPIPDEGSTSNIAFKNLKKLDLQELPALKHFWKNPYQNNVALLFSNLSSIYLYNCGSLRNLFSLSMSAKDCLLQLKSLEIRSCVMMEQVFLWNEEKNERHDIGPESHCGRHIKIFPKLEKLTLFNLPRLTTLCKGIERIEFPLLNEIKINACPQLKSLVSNTTFSSGCGINQNNLRGINQDHDDDDSLHLFCKTKEVAFDRLRVFHISRDTVTLWCHRIPMSFFTGLENLEIQNCNKIKSLFSSLIAENLVNLKKMEISSCKEMVTVIDDREEKDACPQTTTPLFPSLEFLELRSLHKLEMFCGWRSCALELASLKTVKIHKCPKMERFSFASLTTPNLEEIWRPRRRINLWQLLDFPEVKIKSEDLNDGVQQVIFKEKIEEEIKKRIEEEEEEEGEEEHKRKCEIEEEQV